MRVSQTAQGCLNRLNRDMIRNEQLVTLEQMQELARAALEGGVAYEQDYPDFRRQLQMTEELPICASPR